MRTTKKKRKSRSLYTILRRIGMKFSELRREKGYRTIKKFAHDHKLPLIQYWRVEKGKANLTINTLLILLSIHHLTMEDFFCWLKDYA